MRRGRTLLAVRTADFDYHLPSEAIAQQPAARREDSRLLVHDGPGAPPRDCHIHDLPTLLSPGDLLVVNTTRVLPARLRLAKVTGGAAEVLLVRPLDDDPAVWQAMVRPGRRLSEGTLLWPEPLSGSTSESAPGSGTGFHIEVGGHLDAGLRVVTIRGVDNPMDAVEEFGHIPLPPYIEGPLADVERYQTVFADQPSSVAAPTAGLHLTEELIDACERGGVRLAHVELAIGPGTFVPVTAERLSDHVMHVERYHVPGAAIDAIGEARQGGGSVVAVGTTVVRALESWALTGHTSGDTGLFITPGFEFKVVDRLMTNFHQPRSTLLVLLEAFMGPGWRELYAHALAGGYRFLSLGDAMLVNGTPAQGRS